MTRSAAPVLATALVLGLLAGGPASAAPFDGAPVAIAVTPDAALPDVPALWPVTTGVPVADGALAASELGELVLTTSSGTPIPAQFEVRGSHPGSGAVRWLGVSFRLHPGELSYVLRARQAGESNPIPPTPVVVDDLGPEWRVTTGSILDVRVPKAGPRMLRLAKLNGGNLLADRPDWNNYLRRADGSVFTESDLVATLESAGPLHSVVKVTGNYTNAGVVAGTFVARLHFYAGRSMIRVVHTFTWVGSQEVQKIRELALRFPVVGNPTQGSYDLGADPVEGWGSTSMAGGGTLSLSQDRHAHFGQPHDAAHSHFAANRTGSGALASGLRAGHWITHFNGTRGVTVVMKDLWQQFPKKLTLHYNDGAPTGAGPAIDAFFWGSDDGGPDFDLTPAGLEAFWGAELTAQVTTPGTGWADDYLENLRPFPTRLDPTGVSKTHELLVILHHGDVTSFVQNMADGFQYPPRALPDPAYIASTGVLPGLAPRDPLAYPELEGTIDRSFGDVQHVLDDWGDYGFYAFGQGPHLSYDGDTLASAWRYDQNDYSYELGIWRAYLRSGDPALFAVAEAHTRFKNDLQLCHDARSPSRKVGDFRSSAGGMTVIPWAGRDAPAWMAMGGDFGFSIEHALLHYYLTGDRRSLDAFEEYAAALKSYVQANGDAGYAASRAAASYANASRWYFQKLDDLAVAYLQLGDPWFESRAVELADQFLQPSQVGGLRYEPQATNGVPEPYPVYSYYKAFNVLSYLRAVDGAEREEARESLRKLADWAFRTYTESARVQEGRGIGAIMGAGYELTGYAPYLAFGLDILRQFHNRSILDEGDGVTVPPFHNHLYYSEAIAPATLFPGVNSNDPDADVGHGGALKSNEEAVNGPHLMSALAGLPQAGALYETHYVDGAGGDGLPVFHKSYQVGTKQSPAVTLAFEKAAGAPLHVEYAASALETADPAQAPFDPAWFSAATTYTVNLQMLVGVDAYAAHRQFMLDHPLEHRSLDVPASAPAGVYRISCPAQHQLTVFGADTPFSVE